MAKEVLLTADKLHRRKKTAKVAKITSLVILAVLTVIFVILTLIFKGGKFVIQLDKGANRDSNLAIYDFKDDRDMKRKLYADEMPYMDNISIKWIPKDIDTEKEGSHNGNNYIAYTFYVENIGDVAVNYWYEIVIDDVIKRVDEGIRIMIYLNGEPTVYAKKNADTNEAEPDTTAFYEGVTNGDEYIAVLEQRKALMPGEPDRITVVVWIEGDDPDTVNTLIGGDIKMHMNIREERINQNELEKLDEDNVEEPEEEENKEEEDEQNK